MLLMVQNLLMATGEGGNAPGTAGPLLPPWPQGAEFLGVVEFETELGFEGTLTGWDGVGGGGGAGTAGRMKGWLKNVSKSILCLASRFSSPLSKFASSAEVPLGILKQIQKRSCYWPLQKANDPFRDFRNFRKQVHILKKILMIFDCCYT